jgi:hypothetical protein
MSDDKKIFELYLENVEKPQMVEDAHGNKKWYLHGEPHREDGPAVELANGFKSWWLHGRLHREDGPAVEYIDGSKEWWLNGMWYKSTHSWGRAVLSKRNQPHDDAAIDAFLRPILKKGVEEAL